MESNYQQSKPILTAAGFVYSESCQCGGSLQHKWVRKRIQIKIFPNKNPEVIQVIDLNSGTVMFTCTYSNLEQKLNELV